MTLIAFVLVAFVALAGLCALLLLRSRPAPVRHVSPMKATLERRIREGAEFRM